MWRDITFISNLLLLGYIVYFPPVSIYVICFVFCLFIIANMFIPNMFIQGLGNCIQFDHN